MDTQCKYTYISVSAYTYTSVGIVSNQFALMFVPSTTNEGGGFAMRTNDCLAYL